MNGKEIAELKWFIPFTTECHYKESNVCPIQGNLACSHCYSNAKTILGVIKKAGYVKLPDPDSKEYQELREKIAKWLFENKQMIRNPQFYARWEDEVDASPYAESNGLELADKVLALLKEM